jgi:hypothetical protein
VTPGPGDASATSAVCSSPRRWCRHARSWSGPSARRGRTRASVASSTASCATTREGRRSSPTAPTSRLSWACGCCSSARTSTTPGRTRSTTSSARRCWPGAWARPGWWPRPGPASTAWPPPRLPRCWDSTAPSTWATSTWSARRSTSSACGCSAPRSGPRRPAAAPSRTPSTRPCGTGWPASSRRTTAWARRWARIRTRSWCVSCSGSSATRRGTSAGRCWAATPTWSWPAWAAGPTPSASSRRSWTFPASTWSARSRPAVRPSATASRAWSTAPSRCCSRTRRAKCWRPSRSPRASTTRASGPSTPTWPRSAGRATSRWPTPRCSMPSPCWHAPRA